MKKTLWMFAFALLPLAACCGHIEQQDDGNNPYKPINLSTKQSGFVKSGNAFACRFLGQIDAFAAKDKQDDWFVSPLSLQIALGMLLNGAQGETADEICRMLGYGDGETAEVNVWCKLMLEQLPGLDKKTSLTLANAIFYNKDISLKGPFKERVNNAYGATLEALDFSKVKASAGTINDWCKKQTEGMIPEVLDGVDPRALAYLINALYFKSEWARKFPKSDTANETFTREDGSSTKVKMMKLAGKNFDYRENDLYQSVQLPYGNGAFAMSVLLPKKDHTVAEIAAALGKDGFSAGGISAEVDLWLPRFETKYHITLNEVLQAMGMTRSFIPGAADFFAMCDRASYVDFVQQDAAVKVDEEGTEAAAVTVIAMEFTSSGTTPRKVVFHADRPFLYLITETSTGAILFAGKYAGKQ